MKILLVCVFVAVYVHVHSMWEAWQIQEPDFLTAHSQNNQALGRVPQLKYSFLKKRQNRRTEQRKSAQYSPHPSSLWQAMGTF